MSTSVGWQLKINHALNGSFLQPDGPSRPGTEWVVAIHDGDEERRVLIRSYADDMGDLDIDGQAQAVFEYVGSLLQSGWTPDDYTGKPGELTVPARM